MTGLLDWLKKAYGVVYKKDGLIGVVVVTVLLLAAVALAWYLGVFG